MQTKSRQNFVEFKVYQFSCTFLIIMIGEARSKPISAELLRVVANALDLTRFVGKYKQIIILMGWVNCVLQNLCKGKY